MVVVEVDAVAPLPLARPVVVVVRDEVAGGAAGEAGAAGEDGSGSGTST